MVDTVPTHFGWRMPVDVRFGAGCADAVPQELGERAAVVMAFEPATALGWRDRWTQALGSRLRDWVEVPDGLSSVARCRELSGRVWSALAERPDTVLIGLGGGTTLDVAKVLRCRPWWAPSTAGPAPGQARELDRAAQRPQPRSLTGGWA